MTFTALVICIQVLFKHLQEKLLLTEVCYAGMGLSDFKSLYLLNLRLQYIPSMKSAVFHTDQ